MKRFLAFSILFSAIIVNANSNVFSVCEKLPTNQAVLTCHLSVVDELIKKEMGQASLAKATREAKASCSSVAGSIKLHPSLRLLASLECQRDYKIKFYNKDVK